MSVLATKQWHFFKFKIALFFSLRFNTFTVPGCKTSMLDFAPAFSAVIFGVSNTVANFTGFLAPQTTGLLLQDDNSLERWQLAFWISALVYLPGFFLFLIFGTDELQEWAKEVKEGGEEKDKEKI